MRTGVLDAHELHVLEHRLGEALVAAVRRRHLEVEIELAALRVGLQVLAQPRIDFGTSRFSTARFRSKVARLLNGSALP
jgi:hypothetical protein